MIGRKSKHIMFTVLIVCLFSVSMLAHAEQGFAVSFYDGDTLIAERTAEGGEVIPPLVNKAGYKFIGWFTAQEGGEEVTQFNQQMAVYARWAEIGDDEISLLASFENGKIVLFCNGDPGYSYQYWIRSKVVTDLNASNMVTGQYIWRVAAQFAEGLNSLEIEAGPDDIDEAGNYAFLVRVKKDGMIIRNIYQSYSPEALGKLAIGAIEVNGMPYSEMALVSNTDSEVAITASGANVAVYKLLLDGELIAESSSGELSWDISGVSSGKYKLTIIAEGSGQSLSKAIEIYIYEPYDVTQKPVIKSLTGTTDSQTGMTQFEIDAETADGNPLSGCVYTLSVAGRTYTSEDGSFSVSLGAGRYGVYQVTGTVKRSGRAAPEDTIIIYYHGFTRQASIAQSADKYEAEAGSSIAITSSGSIDGVNEQDLLYAYYREDASGWVLIRNYAADPAFTWIPSRPGTYKILSRVKTAESGSYEAETSKTYVITGGETLEGELSVSVSTLSGMYLGGKLVTSVPYVIKAGYSGGENVLYSFVLWSQKTMTRYLRGFSPNPSCLFIPNISDSYVLTMRAISVGSYGYKDIDFTLEVQSQADYSPIVDDSGATFFIDELNSVTIPVETFGAVISGLSYQGSELVEGEDYTASGGSVTISGSYLAGIYRFDNYSYDFSIQTTIEGAGSTFTVSCPEAENRILNGGFETGDLYGWNSYGIWKGETGIVAYINDRVVSGTYFSQGYSYNRDGKYNLGTYGGSISKDSGEERMGILRSSDFVLGGSGWVSFKMGGGKNSSFAYISIKETGTNIEVARFGNPRFKEDGTAATEARLFKYYFNLGEVGEFGKSYYFTVNETASFEWCVLSADSFISYYEVAPTGTGGDFDGGKELAVNIVPQILGAGSAQPRVIPNGALTQNLDGWQNVNGIFKIQGSRARSDQGGGDAATGVLRSSAFKIGLSSDENFIKFVFNGGLKYDKQIFISVKEVGTNIEVIRAVRRDNLSDYTGDGRDNHWIDLRGLDLDKEYYLEICDNVTSGWGLVFISEITFTNINSKGPDGDKCKIINDIMSLVNNETGQVIISNHFSFAYVPPYAD